MADDPLAYAGYWNWGVRYRHAGGVVELPVGWPDVAAVPISAGRSLTTVRRGRLASPADGVK